VKWRKEAIEQNNRDTEQTTHMVINVAQAFRHETQVCSLSPDEKIKPHVQYFTLPNLLMYLWKPANIHPM
jgi:hypothetical protein